MKDEDSELFKSEMDSVEPLRSAAKVILKGTPADDILLRQRREAAAGNQVGDARGDPLSSQFIERIEPMAVLNYAKPGVQHGVLKKMRLGKYQLDARLDLHRMTVEQARAALIQFVRDCLQHDVRCALITHGKGVGRTEPAILKSCLATWLPQLEEILAFHSAQPQHGGTGATYILVRKSEQKRQENWERHIGRRGK